MLNNNIIKQPIYLVHYNLVNKTIFSTTNLNNTYDTYYFYLSNLENAHCKKNYKKMEYLILIIIVCVYHKTNLVQ